MECAPRIAGERPARPTAQLIAKYDQGVDHDPVMAAVGSCHRPWHAVDTFVAALLVDNPGEEFVFAHTIWERVRHLGLFDQPAE